MKAFFFGNKEHHSLWTIHILIWVVSLFYSIMDTIYKCTLLKIAPYLLIVWAVLFLCFYTTYYFSSALLFRKRKVLWSIIWSIIILIIATSIYTLLQFIIPMEYCFGEQVSVTWFYFYFNFFINLQSTIVLVFLAYFVYYIEYTKSKELIEKTKQIEYLKKQVSPHLLLNELNSLYYVASSNKNSELTERIKNLINWLRYSLYKIEQNSISIKEEIEHLENYFIHIKHYSNFPQNNINFHNSLSDKEMDIKIPPLTLFTFVENCVKHSHFLYIKNSSIRIIFESIDNKIYFKFENSVTGNQQNPSQKETQGLGIQNVKNRLKHHFDGDWKITQSTNNQAHYTEIIIFK